MEVSFAYLTLYRLSTLENNSQQAPDIPDIPERRLQETIHCLNPTDLSLEAAKII